MFTSGFSTLLLQFLGSTEVDQPKGIEVVKEGIRKLKFAQQIKKAEGTKTPKVGSSLLFLKILVQPKPGGADSVCGRGGHSRIQIQEDPPPVPTAQVA